MDVSPTWGSDTMVQLLGAATGVKVKPIDALRAARKVPKHAIFLSTTASIPVYITLEAKKDKSGKEIAKKYIAYMYLPSFSGGSDASVTEVKESLKKLEAFGVKDLIIDLIDNGGGALDYGFKLAQALTPNNLVLPEIAFKLSDFWLDQFESRSLKASSDPEREIARRVFDGLQKDIEAGKGPLSRPWSIHDLSPFTFRGNSDLKETPNIVLLVNEHCASMCDIFAATLQDNKMATLIGSDTLGAGGNVVTHRQAPNSHFLVNLTESMVLRRDGTPIENKKVKPTIAMDVAATRFDSYEPVRQRAVDFFLTGK